MAGPSSTRAGNGRRLTPSEQVEEGTGAVRVDTTDLDKIHDSGRQITTLDYSATQDTMVRAAGPQPGQGDGSDPNEEGIWDEDPEVPTPPNEPQPGEFEVEDEGTREDIIDGDATVFIEPPLVDDKLTMGPDGRRVGPEPAPPTQPVQPAQTVPLPSIPLPMTVAAGQAPPLPALPAAQGGPPLPAPDEKGFWTTAQATAHFNWHDFHHKGHGQWSLGLPPAGSDPRTGVKGPGAAQWKLDNPLKPKN